MPTTTLRAAGAVSRVPKLPTSGLATVRVGVRDWANTNPGWGFNIVYSLRETIKDNKFVVEGPGHLDIAGQLASFRAKDFQASGVITDAKVDVKASFKFKKDQKYLVYIEEPESPERVNGRIKKYVADKWLDVEQADYYRAIVKFTVYERTENEAGLSVSATKDKVVTGVNFTGGVQIAAKGTVEIIIVPGHKSSYAKVTIGAATSGTESGTGYAEGNWHYPKRGPGLRGERNEYQDIKVNSTEVKASNPRTAWSFEWENAP